MICNKCYYNNDENSMFCVKCGEKLEEKNKVQTQNSQVQKNTDSVNYNNNVNVNNMENVPTYNMANAIVALVVSLCCCSNIIGIVFAILSIVEGSKVSQFVRFGDIASAKASLDQAKKWVKYAWISFAIWIGAIIIFYIVYFVFIFGMFAITEM
ncbi:MAG TPA: hypothetical protein DCZ30_00515 [Clostridiales bacterium]|nr:hypothetical protein [Clostridiales bacterium]